MAEKGASLSSGSLRLYALAQPTQGRKPLLVGAVDLYAYDPLNRRAAVGIMVATEHRRQGYALAMLQALEKLYSTPHNAPLGQGATEGWTTCSTPSPLRGTPPDPGGESEPAHNAPLGQGSCRVATEGWTDHSTPSPLRGTPPDPGGESERPNNAPLRQGSCREATEGWMPSPLHTLYADIAATNSASLALFRKAGYTVCGHFKDWLAITPLRPAATSPESGEELENASDSKIPLRPAATSPGSGEELEDASDSKIPLRPAATSPEAGEELEDAPDSAIPLRPAATSPGSGEELKNASDSKIPLRPAATSPETGEELEDASDSKIPLRPAATSPGSGEELENAPDSDKNFPEGHAILNSPPGSGGVPRRGEGVESSVHPSVASRQLPCPRGASVGSPDSPPCQGEGGINHEGNTTYIDTIRMQLILT